MRSLKNNVKDNLKKESFIMEFDKILQENKYDIVLNEVFEKVKILRHNRFGHFQRKWIIEQGNTLINTDKLSFQELKECGNRISRLFDLLCFSHGRSLYFLDYMPNARPGAGMDSRSDIDKILDLIIAHSPFVNEPEEQRDYWESLRQVYSKERLDVLNHYRKRVGLDPV